MDENRKETANRMAEDAARQALPAAPPQTDGDDIYHTKYIDFKGSAYDPRGMEQWLAERAAEGDELVRWEQFREGEKHDCRFYLEPAAEKGEPDELLRRKRESLGWEYVCTTKNDLFYIWRGDLSTHIPMPREQTDSYGYRLVCKKLRRSYGMPLFYAAADAVLFYILYRVLTLPVLSLLRRYCWAAFLECSAARRSGEISARSSAPWRNESTCSPPERTAGRRSAGCSPSSAVSRPF